jgi:microcystin degradation protein MlrC
MTRVYVTGVRANSREIVLVNTPGVTSSELGQLEYVRRRRPLYPFEADATY